jgi:putative ATPase
VIPQAYAPDQVAGRSYYEPSRHGAEARYAERSERIKQILGRDGDDGGPPASH